jgi:hypothetical protein
VVWSYTWSLVVGSTPSKDILDVFHGITGAPICCSEVNLAGSIWLQVLVDGQFWHYACLRVDVTSTLPIEL